MTGPVDPPQPLPNELTEVDERALDAMLREACSDSRRRGQLTRDFTGPVLLAVQQRNRQANTLPPSPPDEAGAFTRRGIQAGVWLSVAAAVLLMVGVGIERVRSWKTSPVDLPRAVADEAASSEASQLSTSLAESGTTGAAAHSVGPDAAVSPVRKPPLRLGGPTNEDQPVVATTPPSDVTDSPATGSSLPSTTSGIASVPRPLNMDRRGLETLNRKFVEYWDSLGIQPAPFAELTAWSDRVADRFGIDIQPSDHAESLTGLWDRTGNAEALASRLVDQLSKGLRATNSDREAWVASAAHTIRMGGNFDVWVASWVRSMVEPVQPNADSPNPSSTHRPDELGEWFASRVAGADAGCARCHDSPIDSRFVQHDYWSIAALFAGPDASPTFYELADGRQRVAAPAVPARWLDGPDNDSPVPVIASKDGLDRLIVGNRQVARTLANHLWEIAFGTPLVASASSPIAPPFDETIDQTLELLATHLMTHGFDIRAAADWVIASDPMRRGLPEVFRNDRWQLAAEDSLVQASLAQRSFAAARAHWPPAGRPQLLAMMKARTSELPTKIGPQDSVLAQPLTIAPVRPRAELPTASPTVQREDHWWAQWMADREGLRGGWLESITDPEQQRRHAFYAAGHRQFTPEHQRIADELLGPVAAGEENLEQDVAKLFWIIQNGN